MWQEGGQQLAQWGGQRGKLALSMFVASTNLPQPMARGTTEHARCSAQAAAAWLVGHGVSLVSTQVARTRDVVALHSHHQPASTHERASAYGLLS